MMSNKKDLLSKDTSDSIEKSINQILNGDMKVGDIVFCTHKLEDVMFIEPPDDALIQEYVQEKEIYEHVPFFGKVKYKLVRVPNGFSPTTGRMTYRLLEDQEVKIEEAPVGCIVKISQGSFYAEYEFSDQEDKELPTILGTVNKLDDTWYIDGDDGKHYYAYNFDYVFYDNYFKHVGVRIWFDFTMTARDIDWGPDKIRLEKGDITYAIFWPPEFFGTVNRSNGMWIIEGDDGKFYLDEDLHLTAYEKQAGVRLNFDFRHSHSQTNWGPEDLEVEVGKVINARRIGPKCLLKVSSKEAMARQAGFRAEVIKDEDCYILKIWGDTQEEIDDFINFMCRNDMHII